MASINTTKKTETKELSQNLKFQREKDRTPVRGKFIFHELPGGKMEFPYRKYPGEPIVTYSFTDGEIKTIPLGVAKHLNANCWYPEYKYIPDENGRPTTKIGQKIRRCSFQSLEFIDVEGVAPVGTPINDIITVENI